MDLMITSVILTTLFVLTQTQHAVIGSYGEINATFCGLTKESMKVSDKCFQWHKNTISAMSAARDVTEGEAPWTVLIKFKYKTHLIFRETSECTGVIIAQAWALTSAHCVPDDITEITVVTGYADPVVHSYEGKTAFKHQLYVPKQYDSPSYDIALVLLSQKISITKSKGMSYFQNTICLPKKNIKNTGSEYVMVSGWGQAYAQRRGLQMGSRLLETTLLEHTFSHSVINRENRVCEGDSGAPLWQFYEGRAVLVGILSTGVEEYEKDEYGCGVYPGSGYAVRVSEHIDWILWTIRDNQKLNV